VTDVIHNDLPMIGTECDRLQYRVKRLRQLTNSAVTANPEGSAMPRVPAELRRQQLVAAAFRVIGRDGFAAATTRRVCAEAGAPLAAFHYCFASKQELLAELTEQTMAGLAAAQQKGPPPQGTVEESLVMALRHYWQTVEDDPNREAVLMALTQHALRETSLDGVAQRQYMAYHETARITLEAIGKGCGAIWTLPVEQVARMLVVITDGVTLAWLVDRDSAAARAALDAFAGQLAGLAVPAT
jgi:TetR/AcrR family transcriptional regulator, regulator of biofilm formation and stress response